MSRYRRILWAVERETRWLTRITIGAQLLSVVVILAMLWMSR